MHHINGDKLVQRLVNCGWTETNAIDTCMYYAAKGDWDGLEKYIRECELMYDDRREYPPD